MGKLEGKVAVITGGSSGLALASAKRFVEEGAYVFITGRRQEALDEAVKRDWPERDRRASATRPSSTTSTVCSTAVKREKGKVDVLFASAGKGEAAKLGGLPAALDAGFDLIVRGTLFTVQKALPLFNDGGSSS